MQSPTGGAWWACADARSRPEARVSVMGRGARVRQRSCSWDPQWGVDPSHMSQTLTRPIGADSELSLPLDPSGDLSLIS